MRNPPPIRNEETPTTDTLLARWWVSRSWGYLFRRRQELGVARYGVPLQPFNGRDAILDAAEEFQDATVYAEQCIREGRLPVFAGAVVQILCLFALRVLWYYADPASRDRMAGRDGYKPVVWKRWYDAPEERIEVVLEPTSPTADEINALNVRLKELDFNAQYQGAISAGEAEEDNDLEMEPEPEQALQGFWAQNGPIYNDQHSWQWVGPGNNRGHSASRFLDRIWEDRLRSENASEA